MSGVRVDVYVQPGTGAQDQILGMVGDETYVVAGIDGNLYVVQREHVRYGGKPYVVKRLGYYGPERVTEAGTPKGAIQNLNAYHESRGLDGSFMNDGDPHRDPTMNGERA